MNKPGDIFSLKLPYLSECLEEWPVRIEEVSELLDSLKASLADVVLTANSLHAKNIFLIVHKWILVEYVSLIHGCLIVKKGNNLTFSDKSPMFLGLQEQGSPYGNGVAPLAIKRGASSCWAYNKSKVKTLLKQFQWAGLRGALVGSVTNPNVITVIGHNPLLLDALRITKQPAYFLYPEQLMPPKTVEIEKDLSNEVFQMGRLAKEKLLNILETIGWNVNKHLHKYLERITNNLLYQALQDYVYVKQKWKTGGPTTLWTGSGGNYWVRIARAITQLRGGDVWGYEHGGPTGVFSKSGVLEIEGLFANKFVEYSDAAAMLYRNRIDHTPFIYPDIEISGAKLASRSNKLTNLVDSEKRKKLPKRIQRLMYVPTIFRGERQDGAVTILMDDLVYLDWQIRVINTLSRAGYEVLCKPHPEGGLKGEPFQFTECCRFLYDRFEHVLDQADAFLFDYSASTTFWHAICSRKPVIWIDHGLYPWRSEPYELIKKRCRIVPAFFDDHNRLQTNWDNLLDVLAEPVSDPDMSFVRTYQM